MPCRDCQHYIPSSDALRPRPGLNGWGYCGSAKTAELRARFFPESQSPCWQTPSQFKERRDATS